MLVQSLEDPTKTRRRNVNLCKLVPKTSNDEQTEASQVRPNQTAQADQTIEPVEGRPIKETGKQRMDSRLRQNVKQAKRFIELYQVNAD